MSIMMPSMAHTLLNTAAWVQLSQSYRHLINEKIFRKVWSRSWLRHFHHATIIVPSQHFPLQNNEINEKACSKIYCLYLVCHKCLLIFLNFNNWSVLWIVSYLIWLVPLFFVVYQNVSKQLWNLSIKIWVLVFLGSMLFLHESKKNKKAYRLSTLSWALELSYNLWVECNVL